MTDGRDPRAQPRTVLERVSEQVAQVDREVVELRGRVDDHLREHKAERRQAAAAAKASASARQARLMIAVGVLSPIATTALARWLHLG